ncbi:c-type cytochrome [Bacteroidota bacterium]
MIRKSTTILTPILLFGVILFTNSCKHEVWVPDNFNPSPEDPVTVSATCHEDTAYFQNEILPILQSSCATPGCHDAITREDGVVLTDYANVIGTAEITAGQPNESKLYEVLFATGKELMPPANSGFTFSQQQKDAIKSWISQGAKNNACNESTCDTVSVSFTADIKPIFEEHCYSCHSGEAVAANGIRFNDYAQIAAYKTRLVGAITHQIGYLAMPQYAAMLPDCKIATIRNWINEGTSNN